jgi:Uma2 family endonuclease
MTAQVERSTVRVEQRLFTIAEVEQMVTAGILGEDDHVELIEGVLVKMSPTGFRHAGYADRLNALFSRLGLPDIIIRVQSSIQLVEHSAPQPDLALLRFREDYYMTGHPRPEDVLLAVEVAETSLAYDRDVKLGLYAKALIPEVWLLDVVRKILWQYTDSDGATYRSVARFERGQEIVATTIPGLRLSTTAILG